MVEFTDSPIEWENEFEEDNQNEKWIVKHHIMFLIDASESMFTDFNKSTFFSSSIEICKTVVMKLLRKGRNDKIGLMLVGTNDDTNCPKYINVISEPRKPNIELIKTLEDLQLADQNKYGQSASYPLADALWYSNYIIKKYHEKQSCSSIMLLTCNDQPRVGDIKKQFNLRKRLDDIIKNDIDFKLIPIGATFNVKIFYQDVLNKFNNITIPTNGLENVDDIVSEIDGKIKHGRSVSKISFFIDDNNYISVSLYNFYTKSKIPSKVKLDKRTNKTLVSLNQVFTTDTEELMYKSDLAKHCTIAQQNIIFKNQDISILKNSIIEPGIKLLGFTCKEKILISYHYKTPSFIHPNNEIVEGSSLLFNSLLECCLEMQKIIMCYIKVRQGGRVHLAALFPQAEVLNEYGTQKYPSGFHVMYLPFFECLKPIKPKLNNDNLPKITDQQVSIAKLICEKMHMSDYCPTIIKNPKIQFHWAILEAMALELEAPKVLDETLPVNDVIDKNLSKIKNYISDLLLPSSNNPPVAVSKKRGISSSNNGIKRELKKKK